MTEPTLRANGRGNNNSVFGFHELMGVWVTARCPLRCQHCMFGSVLEEQDLPHLEDLMGWLEQAAQTGRMRLISLTGGEPFYVFDKLKTIVAHGARLKMRLNAVTNAYWASSTERAQDLLGQLQGLTDLYISVDEFHAKYVPLDYVLNASRVGYELGLRVSLAVSFCRREDFERYKSKLEQSLDVPIPIVPVQIVRQGNAGGLQAERFDLEKHLPRGMCHGTNVPMIDKNGTVYACCEPPLGLETAGNPLVLGNLHQEPLSTVLARAEESPFIQALRVWGPRYLAQLAIKLGFRHKLSLCYPRDSICEVCYELLRDGELVAVLMEALAQPQVQKEIAVRRLYLFGEGARTWVHERDSISV